MATWIDLTDEQMRQIKSEMDKVMDASLDGEPGMLLAQVKREGKMKVGFFNNEQSKKFQAVLGGPVGKKTCA